MQQKRFHKFFKRVAVPHEERALESIATFSPLERVVFGFFVILLVGSTLALLFQINEYTLVSVPERGGALSEGVVGSPRFINPLLAASDSDRDLTALVYSGLLRPDARGELAPDLASRYSISEDGLAHTFSIKDNATFHDGRAVTADDVVFTIEHAKDPFLKSPRRASWEGVSVLKIDDRTVQFVLSQPYAPFLENTTLGILPKHIWEEVSAEQFPFSQFNVEPIGSGPFEVNRIKRNSAGLPEFYELTSFEDYALGKPYIDTITLRFYTNEEDLIDAYKRGDIAALNSIAPETLVTLNAERIEHTTLPRIFGVFFNQNQVSAFADQSAREALDVALDKEALVSEILGGYGVAIYSPIPPGVTEQATPETASLSSEERLSEARAILEVGGWELNEETSVYETESDDELRRLSFTLATSNTPELKAAAEFIQASWNALGADVELQFFDTADLNLNIIRPRRYDALLFGEIVGRELDLFAFWHSSQRNDPGLNIALYANITADDLLEQARQASDREERRELFEAFEEEVQTDTPSVFVYAPDFIYVVPEKLQGLELSAVTTSADRFLNVHEWFIESDRVWSFFAK